MTASVDNFIALDIRSGTICQVSLHPKSNKPMVVLQVDFGPVIGFKTSLSHDIAIHYKTNELIGKKVVGVINLPAKKIGGIKSEALLLATVDDSGTTHLLMPDKATPNGVRVA